MATELSICNMALGLLGADSIQALDENTQAARICQSWYEHSRDALQRAHPWSFLVHRAASYPFWDEDKQWYQGDRVQHEGTVYEALDTTIGDAPDGSPSEWEETDLLILAPAATPVNEYPAAFELPADCLRVLYVNPERRGYRIEGQRLLTTTTDAVLVYLKRETDPDNFDSLFVRALSYFLAIDMAPSLARSARRQGELEKHFRQVILPEATSANAFEREGDAYIRSEWEAARL